MDANVKNPSRISPPLSKGLIKLVRGPNGKLIKVVEFTKNANTISMNPISTSSSSKAGIPEPLSVLGGISTEITSASAASLTPSDTDRISTVSKVKTEEMSQDDVPEPERIITYHSMEGEEFTFITPDLDGSGNNQEQEDSTASEPEDLPPEPNPEEEHVDSDPESIDLCNSDDDETTTVTHIEHKAESDIEFICQIDLNDEADNNQVEVEAMSHSETEPEYDNDGIVYQVPLPQSSTEEPLVESAVETEYSDCIICNSKTTPLDDPRKLNSVNLKLKHYFCLMMGMSDAEGVRTSFDQSDAFPFCEECTVEVGNLMALGTKIELLYKQFDKLRDSLALRSAKTFFERTRPDLVEEFTQQNENSEVNTSEGDPTATTLSTPWVQLTKRWKAIYESNLPGPRNPAVLARSLNTRPRLTTLREFKKEVSSPVPKNGTQLPKLSDSVDVTSTPVKLESVEVETGNSISVNPSGSVSGSDPVDSSCSSSGAAKTYQCPECPKSFLTSGILAYHSRIHTGELPFECETCGKGFAVPHYLMIHMRSHSGEKPFKCEVCNKGFAQRGGLITHSLVHTGAKPYACDVCDKSFRQKYHLTQHLLIHSGSKPFGCDICGKFFNVKMNLREHKRRHTGDRPYKCPHCVCIGFFRKRMLRDHVVKAHPTKDLPAELLNLGVTRIPPSLTKEGRRAYKSRNIEAARRRRNRNRKKPQPPAAEAVSVPEPELLEAQKCEEEFEEFGEPEPESVEDESMISFSQEEFDSYSQVTTSETTQDSTEENHELNIEILPEEHEASNLESNLPMDTTEG